MSSITGMGTAPGQQQHPAMPDPNRIVARSLYLLSRLGFNDYSSLNLIISVGCQVRGRLATDPDADLAWITSVIADATDRLVVLAPSPTQRSESADADGRRGRTGRNQENQQ